MNINSVSENKKVTDEVTCFKIEYVPETVSLSVKLLQIIRYIGESSKQLLSNAAGKPIAGILVLTTVANLPFALHELAMSVYNIAKTTLNEKIDIFLGAVSNIGGVLDVVANIGEGLAAVGSVAVKTVTWATPLSIAAAAIESIGMVLTAKKMMETVQFSKAFHQAAKLTESSEDKSANYKKVCQLILEGQSQESSFIGKHFGVDSEKLEQRLLEIEQEANLKLSSEDEEVVEEGKQILQTTMQTLSSRITRTNWSHALSLLASTVSIIGFGILFSPCPPAGFILLAVSSVVSIGSYFVNKYLDIGFEEDMMILD